MNILNADRREKCLVANCRERTTSSSHSSCRRNPLEGMGVRRISIISGIMVRIVDKWIMLSIILASIILASIILS